MDGDVSINTATKRLISHQNKIHLLSIWVMGLKMKLFDRAKSTSGCRIHFSFVTIMVLIFADFQMVKSGIAMQLQVQL